MAYWLLKSEPDCYAWRDLVRDGVTEWDGIRNHAAAAHLRRAEKEDRALIYHTGGEKAAVGIAEVTRGPRRDGQEGNWVSIAVKPIAPLPAPVTLAAMKAEPKLAGMAMLRQSRLSVSPVSDAEWAALIAMGGALTD